MKQAAQPQKTVAGFEPFPSQGVVITNAHIDAGQTMHIRATPWLVQQSAHGWASRPVTQNGAVRIMSHPCYPTPTGQHPCWPRDWPTPAPRQNMCFGPPPITVAALQLGLWPDFDAVWAHIWENPNEFNRLNWEFRQTPRYMDC